MNSTFSTLNTDIDLLVFPHFLSTFQDIKSITPTRYEVAYPEMREFFKKIDMFSGGGHRGVSEGYLYSRRIGKVLPDGSNVPILFGLKGQTQFGKNRIGVLEVLTQEKEYIEDGEVKIEPRSLFSAGRFMHHFGTRSDVGVIYMEKRELGPDNLHSVAGIDLNLYSPNDHYLRGKVFGAFNPGKNTDDFMADFDVGQRTSRIFWNIGYSSIGKNFDPNEISYFRQPDRNNLSARGQYSWPELTGFFRSIEVGGSVSQAFNQAGDTNYGHSIRLDGEFETQGYHNLRWNISRRQDRFTANGDQLEQMFTFHSASLDFSSDRRKMLSVSIGPNIGESFDYDDGYKTYTVGIDAGLSIRTEKVQLGLSSRNNFDRPQQKMDGRESRTRGLDVISFSFFSPPHIVSLAAQNNRAYDLRTLDLLYRFEIGPRHFLNIGAGGSWYDGKRNLRGYCNITSHSLLSFRILLA